MTESSSQFRGEFRDVMVITELRGAYPSVPIAADVDYDALIAGDNTPVFITLPIGKANVTSLNKRHYDEAFLQELERQTLANKPVGLMGHLSETERATAFPAEAVHWVGAVRDGDTLWGKAYLVPGAVRDRIQRYKAQGKAIATSIDAFAEGVWDETLKATRMVATSLRLNQIDIAPADRAGIPDLAAIPMLTTEMGASGEATEQEITMSKEELIKELAAVKVPPNKGWQPPAMATQEVTELVAIRETLGASDTADLRQLVSELLQEREEAKNAAVHARISELVGEVIKVASARNIIAELIEAREPRSVADVDKAFAAVIAKPSVKEMLEAAVQQASGPAAIVNGKVREMGARKPLEDTPENRARAAAAMGLNIN